LILIADILPDMPASGLQTDPDACLEDLLLLQSGHENAFDLKTLTKLAESVCASTMQSIAVEEKLSASRSTVALGFRIRT
jgi:hypothetical protein